MAESKEDVAGRREILLEERLTEEEYFAVMRRRVHDAWNNAVITDRDLRSTYARHLLWAFFVQLAATDVIICFCAYYKLSMVPGVISGALTAVVGLITVVVKSLFSKESINMSNELTKAIAHQKSGESPHMRPLPSE